MERERVRKRKREFTAVYPYRSSLAALASPRQGWAESKANTHKHTHTSTHAHTTPKYINTSTHSQKYTHVDTRACTL